jgi:hypothetical protein
VKSTCPGCGLVLPPQPEAPKHPYIGASAECWGLYGALLAREFQHPACLIVEDGVDPLDGPALHKRFVRRPAFRWLAPPRPNGHLTVADALRSRNPEEHAKAARAWGEDVWESWAPHHQTVRGWIAESRG